MDKILVPVDFSDTSGRLLAAAEEAARTRGASLHLLHVIEPVAATAGFGVDPTLAQVEITQDLETEERVEAEHLRRIAEEISGRGVTCDFTVKFGLPADEILSAVHDTGAHLVVLGSHGHGALYHLFTGSVVTGVLRRIDVPVLVVPLRKSKS